MALWSLKIHRNFSFPHFFLHACRNGTNVWYVTLPWWVTDQVYVSFPSANFYGSYGPLNFENSLKFQFSALFFYTLAVNELFFGMQVNHDELQIKFTFRFIPLVFMGVMALWTLKIQWNFSFLHFFLHACR